MTREEQKIDNEDFSGMNDLFRFDDDDITDSGNASDDFSNFDGLNDNEEEESEEASTSLNFEETQGNEQGEDSIDFESETSDEDDDDFNLEVINKKLKTDFKSEKELLEFMNGKKSEQEADTEEKEFQESTRLIETYTPILKLRDKDLMKRQFETIAAQEGKDVTDEYVQMEIDDKIQDLISEGILGDEARLLREAIQEKVYGPAQKRVKEITEKRENQKKEQAERDNKEFQESLLAIAKQGSFFGVPVNNQDIVSVYKERDKFLERLSKDKNALAEAAMMFKYRDKIYKKASGKTYGEGMRDILKEFKTQKNSASHSSRAHSRATSGGSSGGTRDIVSGLLYTKTENAS